MHDPLPTLLLDEGASKPQLHADRTFLRMIVLATLLLWSANFAILTVMSVADGNPGWTALLLPRLALNLVGMAICYGLHRFLQWAGQRGFRRQLMAAAIAVVAGTESYAWSSSFAVWLVHGPVPGYSTAQTILQLSLHFWFFTTWVGFYLAISYGARLRLQQQREATARILAQAAQLQALHYQISPHFLFNTLNSISSLIVDRRNERAEAMVQHLSEFLRLTLALDPGLDVTLERELALQRAYLEIELVRFPDMTFWIEVAPEVRCAHLPVLLLQPLVENAVKHGVAKSLGPAQIEITAARIGDRLGLTIVNRAEEIAARAGASGIGLRNVRDRLAARFGEQARLTACFIPPDRFEVAITMPLLRS